MYRALGLTHRRRTKKRVPTRPNQPMDAPAVLNRTWALDFMHDRLDDGRPFRTLKILDQGNREVLAIEVSPPLPTWCATQAITLRHIQPGKPNQNAYIGRFNRTYRHEVLDAWLFASLDEARDILTDWILAYNTKRPHDSLGGVPPLDLIPRPTSSPVSGDQLST